MNILFLMADEFRRDAAGFGGNAVARTPCLDGLAAGARVFSNAYTPSPVCVPARQCLATGMYPFRNGCEGFHTDLEPGAPTFARWFAEHGHYTVCCGKLHHRGPDQMQGWLQRIGSETAVRWPEAFSERSQIGRRSWRGADDVRAAGAGVSPLAMHDDLTVQGACDFLRMHFGGMYSVPPDVPLLLMVSLQQPHFPLLCDDDLFEHYRTRVSAPENVAHPDHPVLARSALAVSEQETLRARAAYAGMVEMTDRRFARVLETLRECGQNPDEWLIVFTSDHGDLLGDHGCWEKRSFFEASAGIPLFVRGPGIPAGHDERVSNLVDLFPTLCEAAGLPVPSGLDGKSLLAPCEETLSQLGRGHFMLRRGALKYLSFGGDAEDVLFDLAEDPGELRNLASLESHAEIVKTFRARLKELLRERVVM